MSKPMSSLQGVECAIAHLRIARAYLKGAGAKQTKKRVDAALKSADGARRHARLEPYRRERQSRSRQSA
jgi:hypothetical protein